LKEGHIDLMPDIAFSPERDEFLDFHKENVIESWSHVYARRKSPVKKLSELNGGKVALLKGSIQHSVVEQMIRGFGYNLEIVGANSYEEAFSMASDGIVDAVISNQFFGDYFCKEYGLEKTAIVFNPVSLYFATAENKNSDILAAIDRNLKFMKSRSGSVYYLTLERWMERPPRVVLPDYLLYVIIVIAGGLALSFVVIILLRKQMAVETEHLARANESLSENEEKLKDQHRQLQQIFDTLPHALIYADPNYRIVRVNPSFEKIFGYKAKDVVGKDAKFLISNQEEARGMELKWYDPEKSPDFESFELAYRRANGETFTGESVGTVIRNSKGELIGMFALINDTTERRKLQSQLQQAQKMESVGRLASGVAHDFNNILLVILGYGEILLASTKKDDPNYEVLDQIVQAGKRARELTRQLLAFSRKQTLEMHSVDVNQVILGFEKLLRRIIGEDIVLELKLCHDDCRVIADTGQMEQVFMNIAVNARDAMPNGGTMIIQTSLTKFNESCIANKTEIASGEYVLVNISDTGHGMDRHTLDNLFEPFFTTKGSEKGTGLGLATSYGIIKQHGGSIGVYSEPGKGTTFRIYIPMTKEKSVSVKTTSDEPRELRGRETILLVEDDEQVRNVTLAILKKYGYSVICANNGSSAISALDKCGGEVDLLFTDVIMPGIKGADLFNALFPKYPRIKALYMSGYADSLIVNKGFIKEGINFIQKPFSERELLLKIRSVLDKK
ncbi:MAG TPA: PAS domain S-box protein, partial [Victivallales bacterium]|nr:PAS domain S-box protein [Victivallales bacterium]